MTTPAFRRKIFPGVTLHWGSKDGGPKSCVQMYGLECKALCSLLVLRFGNGTRDAYHSHAFNTVSWVLSGILFEEFLFDKPRGYSQDLWPIFTWRSTTHKVTSLGTTWVLSLRGPWARTWVDIDAKTGAATTLTSGRVECACSDSL